MSEDSPNPIWALAAHRVGRTQLRQLTLNMLTLPKPLRHLTRQVSEKAMQYLQARHIFTGLPRRKRVSAIIDWDVLYSYITSEHAGQESALEIRHFFEFATIEYRITKGAVEELRSFLRRYAPFQKMSKSSTPDAIINEALKYLFDLSSGDKGRGFLWVDDSVDSVVDDHKKVQIERLIIRRLAFVLRSRRFLGLFLEADSVKADAFLSMIESSDVVEHRSKRSNRRDANNLAATILLNSRELDRHYVLLTKRRAVRAVAAAYINDMGSLEECTFAMHPDEMFWISLLRFHEYGYAVLATVTDAAAKLHNLAAALDSQLVQVENGALLDPKYERIRRAADACSEVTSSASALSLLELEKVRSPFLGAAHDTSSESEAFEGGLGESFVKTISAIKSIVVDETLGEAYEISRSYVGGACRFEVFDNGTILKEVLCAVVSEVPGEWDIYVPAEVGFRYFLSSVNNLIVDGHVESQKDVACKNVVPLINPQDDDVYAKTGVLVAYSHGILFFQAATPTRYLVECLQSVSALTEMGREYLTPGQYLPGVGRRSKPLIPQILQVAIVGADGQISFDLSPLEGVVERHLRISGAGRIPLYLTEMIERIGPTLVDHERLSVLLNRISDEINR